MDNDDDGYDIEYMEKCEAACDDYEERIESLAAELRWCDAERRLALRALAEYAPECDVCSVRAVVDDYCGGEAPNEFYCERHRAQWKPRKPLPYAAQIAAADEEMGR